MTHGCTRLPSTAEVARVDNHRVPVDYCPWFGGHPSVGLGGGDLPAPRRSRRTDLPRHPRSHDSDPACPRRLRQRSGGAPRARRRVCRCPGIRAAGRNDPVVFRSQGVPGLTPDAYRPWQLQRTIVGQAGVQRFFPASGRAFCLYSVIGAFANRVPLTGRANQLLGCIRVEVGSREPARHGCALPGGHGHAGRRRSCQD